MTIESQTPKANIAVVMLTSVRYVKIVAINNGDRKNSKLDIFIKFP
jgi:hypothetical protein